jgi:hypothetical protein
MLVRALSPMQKHKDFEYAFINDTMILTSFFLEMSNLAKICEKTTLISTPLIVYFDPKHGFRFK